MDAEIHTDHIDEVAKLARIAEEFGFDSLWFDETKHDPFVQIALAATATKRIHLGSSIALAFTRSPTTIAYASWDLQSLAQGRFILGLGSQVKGHMERRFGIKWESPAPKLKEVVQALRAVWQSWQAGTRLDFQGRFFKLDLMTPFFTPPPLPNPRIPIYVAGVNRGMFRVAGEVADGLHLHPLHTVRYLREVMAPAILSGLTKSGRSRHDVWIACPVFTAVGATEAEIQKRKEECRKNIAFYASTRTYRRVLELHGWGDVCDRLHAKTLRGDWKSLAGEVDDDILKEFVIEGAWDDIATRLRGRYSGIVDAVRLYVPFDGSRKWESLVSRFRS